MVFYPLEYFDEDWAKIEESRTHVVSTYGRVMNTKNRRILKPFVNSYGAVSVNFVGRNGVAIGRPVPLLVAKAFLADGRLNGFDAVISLDGDRQNTHVSNLAWRTKSYALKYHKQFRLQDRKNYTPTPPVYDSETGMIFSCARAAAMFLGYIETELLLAIDEVEPLPWSTKVLEYLPDYNDIFDVVYDTEEDRLIIT